MRAMIRQGQKLVNKARGLAAFAGSVPAIVAERLPRRMRRSMEKIERSRVSSIGLYTMIGFFAATGVYSIVAGGYLDGLGDRLLVRAGLGIESVDITGQVETPELAVLERLELDGTSSLLSYDVAEARSRIIGLPWVGGASVRKLYPDELVVTINERKPFALWQRGNVIVLIDRLGTPIVEYSDSRFARLPLLVGYGAELVAGEFVDQLQAYPSLSARTKASVFVSGRRWNLILDSGVTVKLPENNAAGALEMLVRIDRDEGLLARNVSEVDLRLADRIIVRIANGSETGISDDDRVEIRQIAQAGDRT